MLAIKRRKLQFFVVLDFIALATKPIAPLVQEELSPIVREFHSVLLVQQVIVAHLQLLVSGDVY